MMHVANRICLADFADANRFIAYVQRIGVKPTGSRSGLGVPEAVRPLAVSRAIHRALA
jgi:hypothetical protein